MRASRFCCVYKGYYYREVRPHVLGWKAATHRSWFINLAVEVPPACRPAASGGGLTFGKCKMPGFEIGHGIPGQSHKKPESCVDRGAIEVPF
jgi:hypothetical protein